MSSISTHVLDTSRGVPAAGLEVRLEVWESGQWRELADAQTDHDGRVKPLLPSGQMIQATLYRIVFDTGSYYQKLGLPSFYPEVTLTFEVKARTEHYHVPLLLSPYGFSTYRGS
jgi:5-hydroxyisourate hydrolase